MQQKKICTGLSGVQQHKYCTPHVWFWRSCTRQVGWLERRREKAGTSLLLSIISNKLKKGSIDGILRILGAFGLSEAGTISGTGEQGEQKAFQKPPIELPLYWRETLMVHALFKSPTWIESPSQGNDLFLNLIPLALLSIKQFDLMQDQVSRSTSVPRFYKDWLQQKGIINLPKTKSDHFTVDHVRDKWWNLIDLESTSNCIAWSVPEI